MKVYISFFYEQNLNGIILLFNIFFFEKNIQQECEFLHSRIIICFDHENKTKIHATYVQSGMKKDSFGNCC